MKSRTSLLAIFWILTLPAYAQKTSPSAWEDLVGSGEAPAVSGVQRAATSHLDHFGLKPFDIANISHFPFQEPYASFSSYYESFPVVLSNGNLLVVWASRFRDSLYSSQSTDLGITWSSPSFVNLSNYYCYSLCGLKTTSGRIIAVWQSSNSAMGLTMCYSDNDALSWSSAVSISSNTVNRYTSLTQTLDGKIWLFYSRFTAGTGQDVYYRTSSDNGISWSSEFPFLATASTEYYAAVVSADASTLMAVYSDNSSGSFDIYSKTSSDGGITWTLPTTVLNTSASETRPRLLRHADGTLWLVYQLGVNGPGGTVQSDIAHVKSTNGGLSWGASASLTTYAGYDGWHNTCLKDDQPFVTFVSYRWNAVTYQTHLWYGLVGTSIDNSPPPSLYPSVWSAPSHNVPMHALAIVDDENGISNVTVSFHRNGIPFGPVPLYDDGFHDDSLAGDNIWASLIGSFQAGDMVDFSVNVTDLDANTISVYMNSFEVSGLHNVGEVILSFRGNSQLGQGGQGSQQSAFWNGHDYLYMGGLWVGCSINSQPRVSQLDYRESNWYRTPGSPYTIEPGLSDQDGNLSYDDGLAALPVGVRIHQQSYQWSGDDRDDFIIFKYTITNVGTNGSLADIFVGSWTDPDVSGQTISNNDRVGYDSTRGMLYAHDSQGNPGGYIGVRLLGSAPHSVLSYANGQDAYDDNTRYYYLTHGTVTVPTTTADWRMILAAEPFSLSTGDSFSVTFGIVLGDGLSGLQANADTMEAIYSSVLTSAGEGQSKNRPIGIMLNQNYPNPFNPSTVISYQLSVNTRTTLTIYNLLGQEVRTLVNDLESAGMKSVMWDGRDNHGRTVASGVYLYRLQAGSYVQTRKMLMLK
jgi:hypothetical protein